MTDQYHIPHGLEEGAPIPKEQKVDVAEMTIFSALMLRADLDMAWATTNEVECKHNRQRYEIARIRLEKQK
jgi:hypothetical protein